MQYSSWYPAAGMPWKELFKDLVWLTVPGDTVHHLGKLWQQKLQAAGTGGSRSWRVSVRENFLDAVVSQKLPGFFLSIFENNLFKVTSTSFLLSIVPTDTVFPHCLTYLVLLGRWSLSAV